jgi:hypothetical protein
LTLSFMSSLSISENAAQILKRSIPIGVVVSKLFSKETN